MNKNNDEIDLIEILLKFTNWLKGICNSIIMFFIRNAFCLLIFILIGVGLAVVTYFSTERFYNTEMVLQTNAVSSTEMINYLNNFDVKSFNNNSLSIKNIKAYYIIDNNKDEHPDYVDYDNVQDTSITNRRMVDKVDILISVYENAPIDSIKNAIFSYINKNHYFQKVNDLRIKQLNDLISKTDIELQKLDSVETINYFYKDPYQKETGKNMIILNEKEIKLFHNDVLRLYKKKQENEEELFLYKDIVTIIQDFTTVTKVENSLSKKLKQFMLTFFCLGLIFSIFVDQRNNFKVLIKRSKK